MGKKERKSDRSKLVKKHWEHVGWKLYKQALGTKQRGSGIYVLYKGNRVYYVGKSKTSLRRRLREHALKDRHKEKWGTFSLYQIGRIKYIEDIESLLIRIIDPPGNRIKGRFRRKYDLSR